MSSTNENANKEDVNFLAVRTAHVHAYCFTHFNYTDEIEKALQACGADYGVYRAEACPTTKRPHLQGYVYWKNKKRGRALIKAFPGARWLVARGHASSNFVYCSKPDTALAPTVEWGVKPMDQQQKGQTQKDLWVKIAALVDAGDFGTIAEEYPMIDINHYDKLLARYHRKKGADVKALDGDLQGVWIHGPPGTGKSTRVYEMFGENVYPKAGNTKWWCQYAYQENVWIDDFDPTVKKMDYLMKIWTDRWKFIAERKNGSMMIRPKQVVVTSNYTIAECFPEPKLQAAITRRFPTVIYMGEDGETTPPVRIAPIFNPPNKRTAEEAFGEEEA